MAQCWYLPIVLVEQFIICKHLFHCANRIRNYSIRILCHQHKSTKAQIVAGIVPMTQVNLIWAGLNADVHGAATSLPVTTVVMESRGGILLIFKVQQCALNFKWGKGGVLSVFCS